VPESFTEFFRWLAGLEALPGESQVESASQRVVSTPRRPASSPKPKSEGGQRSILKTVKPSENSELTNFLEGAVTDAWHDVSTKSVLAYEIPVPSDARQPAKHPAETTTAKSGVATKRTALSVRLPAARDSVNRARKQQSHDATDDVVRLSDLLASSIVYDLETTGLSRSSDFIIQIGAARIRDGRIVERFSRFVQPPRPIPRFITELTGISDHHVRNAANAVAVLREFSRWAGRDRLVAHNGKSFDSGFIRSELDRASVDARETVAFDTLHLARKMAPQGRRNGLGDLARFYGVRVDGQLHQATTDVEVLFGVMCRLVQDAEALGLTSHTGHVAWLCKEEAHA